METRDETNESEKEIVTPNSKRETQNSSRREHLMLYVPLVLWIGVIFFLSSSQGSFSETSRIIRPLLEFLFPAAPPESIIFYHGIVRKFAHLAEYAVLGFLAVRAFAGRRTILAGLAIVIGVAVADETYQSFNPARTGSKVDVMIDIAGGVIAILIAVLFRKSRSRQ